MKKPIALSTAALVLCLAAGGRLAGQSYRSFREDYDSIREQSKLRFGPVRIVPVFRLSDVGYDSNVYFREEGSTVVSDATATLSPEIRGYWLVGQFAHPVGDGESRISRLRPGEGPAGLLQQLLREPALARPAELLALGRCITS